MSKEIKRFQRKVWLVISGFFVLCLLLFGIIFLIVLDVSAHDYSEPRCFNAIDSWYQENKIPIDYQKRWQQHLECERNMGLFPWSKEPKFSK